MTEPPPPSPNPSGDLSSPPSSPESEDKEDKVFIVSPDPKRLYPITLLSGGQVVPCWLPWEGQRQIVVLLRWPTPGTPDPYDMANMVYQEYQKFSKVFARCYVMEPLDVTTPAKDYLRSLVGKENYIQINWPAESYGQNPLERPSLMLAWHNINHFVS